MSPRLKFLTVDDFRSIRGSVGVSLDAPAVLIHGPNGTGKTSLLAAMELALTGAVPSLARFDEEYLSYLPHKLAKDGSARISVQADGVGDNRETTLVTDGASITGTALLHSGTARFYTERCYLAQTTLGRLLEIYEQQDNRTSASPLTRFVKEMLGLDALDALIDGLHAAGDVRRFREVSPLFWAARSDAPKLEQSVKEASDLEKARRDELARTESTIRQLIGTMIPVDAPIEVEPLRATLQRLVTEDEARLTALARMRRDLVGAQDQVREALASEAAGERAQTEQASITSREALEDWRRTSGRELEAIISAVQARFPDVPPIASDPGASHAAATATVRAARDRTQNAINNDDAVAKSLSEVQVALRQGQGRIEQIDKELASSGGPNRQLAEALTAISSHIENEHCPVCGRDFSEISTTPLAAHVSEEVARLVTAAGRVEALVRDRTSTSTAVVAAQRQEGELRSRRLPTERRDALKVELAQSLEWLNALGTLADAATNGSRLLREATNAAQQLSIMNSRQSSIFGLRAELTSRAEELSLRPFPTDAPLQQIVMDLIAEVDRRIEEDTVVKKTRERALETLTVLAESRRKIDDAEQQLAQATSRRQKAAACRIEAERRITVARDLVSRALAVRADEVRQVFNEELNTVWRELFIRLAPDEAFVPAFALPSIPGRPVEAVLETHYRSGGKGGNPRAMLSAGNLNTAALTLFLALHLSVAPSLPWLLLDDPVQSMDDVHIAQFAALLRTLKQHGRQLVIAVHDRQLFEYLTLELSPTFNGDRLITIELGRDADGMTTAPWSLTAFEPDKAIAA